MNMILLFSHELTKAQIDDAQLNLNVCNFIYLPQELQTIWSNIPPEINCLNDYLPKINKFLKENSEQDDYVLIQGDFGATYLMINYSKSLGLIPIYSTNKRKVKEILERKGVKYKKEEDEMKT